MLKLKRDIATTFLATFVGSFVVLFIVAYFLLQHFFLENANTAVMAQFNTVWLGIGVVFSIVFAISYFFIQRLQNRIMHDTLEIQNYLEAIDAKKYDAPIHIKYYIQYLQIAVLLKNLVKRVKNKDKKR
jgi:low affinity Fe/Cu permease